MQPLLICVSNMGLMHLVQGKPQSVIQFNQERELTEMIPPSLTLKSIQFITDQVAWKPLSSAWISWLAQMSYRDTTRWQNLMWILPAWTRLHFQSTGCHFNMNLPSSQYKKSRHKNKTVSWPSYLYYVNPIPEKTSFISKQHHDIECCYMRSFEWENSKRNSNCIIGFWTLF